MKSKLLTRALQPHEGLLYITLQQMRAENGTGVAVALTSANPGEGVTHAALSLTQTLQRDPATRTLFVCARMLRALAVDPADMLRLCVPTQTNGVHMLDLSAAGGDRGDGMWETNLAYRRECLEYLRAAFDYIVLDCPALQTAGDALTLAPVVDGAVLIVAAESTRRNQVLHAERSLECAQARVLGHILNKRSYIVPQWIYSRL